MNSLIDEKMINEEYIDQATAAQLLKVSRSRINKLCRDGRFNGAIKAGWAWLIPKVAIENFKPLKRGPKTRQEEAQNLVLHAISKAENLKEDDNNDQQR